VLDIHRRPTRRGAGRGVTPVGEARSFAAEELTVSKTDLDASDAFVQEGSATPISAAAGRFHRSVLTGGLADAYRKGATDINAARDAVRERPPAGSPRRPTAACCWPSGCARRQPAS
jgi:hypothetical protein